ncbi:MAG: hypothetical protein J07HX64_00258 [halophilic archaeon J07HX64]|jgi:hypothetical protein|nr:MAG: hypothetical protein J07HX64_00258 [halophilic archaeon J07HX64]
MGCPDCGAELVAFAVPEPLREFVPGTETAVALCPDCLGLQPATDPPADPAFGRVHRAFPTDPDAAVPMGLLLGLLDELAVYRSEIAALLERVEQTGVDPLLVLSRLARDPDIDPGTDLDARRYQLEQLL